MRTYETLFITSPVLTEEEERTSVEGFAQLVLDGGGALVARERMGRRRLAYPIRKHEDGVYTRFLYDSATAVPRELERRLRLSDRVLRVLTVCLEPDWAVAAKEQAILDEKARAEAAERGIEPGSELATVHLPTDDDRPKRSRRDDDDDSDDGDWTEDDE
jgi:small subunit ribosomal protein S6